MGGFALLERKHRAEGITDRTMETYNRVQSEYSEMLSYNKVEFADVVKQGTSNSYKK